MDALLAPEEFLALANHGYAEGREQDGRREPVGLHVGGYFWSAGPHLAANASRWTPAPVAIPDHSRGDHPAAVTLSHVSPAPFSHSARVRLRVDAPVRADLSIYDLGGRLVRRLVRDDLGVGDRVLHWDGYDSNGRRLAAGCYLLRLKAGDFLQTQKIVLVR